MKSPSAIAAKFNRSGIHASKTLLWKNDEGIRTAIESSVIFKQSEIPVLVYFRHAQYWWLLTTVRIIINDQQRIRSVDYSDFIEINLSEIHNGTTSKSENSSIEIKTSNDTIYLQVEYKTWPVIYSILKFVSDK